MIPKPPVSKTRNIGYDPMTLFVTGMTLNDIFVEPHREREDTLIEANDKLNNKIITALRGKKYNHNITDIK